MSDEKTFTPPSKEDIRKKYGIETEDFEILVQDNLPSPDELKKDDSVLETVLDFFGVPTFLLKKGTILLAIIFIPWWGPIAKKNFEECVVTTYNYYEEVVTKFAQAPDPPRYLITLRDPADIARSPIDLKTGSFPVGTGIYPYSSSLDTRIA